jgi:HlyD family secretion protein
VDEADVGGLAIGQKATVTVQAFPGVEFRGTVREIALKHRFSDNRTRYYRTEILLDNDANVAKLYTGLTADVDIQTQRHPNVIRIPTQAILARDVDGLPLEIREKSPEIDKGKKFATVVYRYNDGSAKATPVRTGQSDLTHTIILSGLNEGDKVVVGPYKVLDNLKHDQKLKDEKQVEAEKKAKESKKGKGKSKKDNNDINEPTGK